MTTNLESAFTFTAAAVLAVKSSTSNIVIPTTGTPTIAKLTNVGPNPVAVLQGTSSVTVTPTTGLILQPGEIQYVVLTAAYLAAISFGGAPGGNTLYIAVGN